MENEPETAKRKRAGRTIPKVNVYAVHRAECKHKGDSKRITCGCPKQLAWFAHGKLTREAAPVDYTAAEKAARAAASAEKRSHSRRRYREVSRHEEQQQSDGEARRKTSLRTERVR